MRSNLGKKQNMIFLQITFARVFLLGAVFLRSTSSAITPDEPAQGTEWVNQLVTPQKNISLAKIIGRWFTVEQVRNFSFLPEDLCETFDFFLSADNNSVLVNQTLFRGSDPLNLPLTTVVSDGTWVINSLNEGFKLLDVSPDGGLLSLASCSWYMGSCYGVLLGRDPDLSGWDEALLAAHRGLARAGLNDTSLGHRQRPDACRLGLPVAVHEPVKYYDV